MDDAGRSGVPVALGRRPIHPDHGIHDPSSSTPERRPRSIRRTSTIDSVRPDGILGAVLVDGRARDLFTHDDGTAEVIGTASFRADVDYRAQYALRALTSDPALPGAEQLLGRSVSSGFRGALADLAPHEREHSTLLHLLLDDFPGAVLVSGYVGVRERVPVERAGNFDLQLVDMCAGFVGGGTLLSEREVDPLGLPPAPTGPLATSLERLGDAHAWHDADPLPGNGMRRARRLDVTLGEELAVDVFFRDSHMSVDGEETIIHEYTVSATVDVASRTFADIRARGQVLPWKECINAVDSAAWLRGRSLDGLRQAVRADFRGVHTCTHLNDTLRSLEDVPALAHRLGAE